MQTVSDMPRTRQERRKSKGPSIMMSSGSVDLKALAVARRLLEPEPEGTRIDNGRPGGNPLARRRTLATITLDRPKLDRFDAFAKKLGISRAKLFRVVLDSYMDELQKATRQLMQFKMDKAV